MMDDLSKREELSYYELYTSLPLFGGIQSSIEEAKYVVLGVPLDITSTFRSGSRFAPEAVREASLNIETYDLRTNMDLEDFSIHDLGNLHVNPRIETSLDRLHKVAEELIEDGKIPIFIGGEHTITLGTTRGSGSDVATIVFDAHLDLRNEYLDQKVSHATFLRRVSEEINSENILGLGARAVCKEELEYAKKENIDFFTTQQILREKEKIDDRLSEFLDDKKRIYLSIDMDVLDPSFAPAVQNPEPNGLSYRCLLDILQGICDQRMVAFDLVEITPSYDHGITAILAAKIIFEIICQIEKSRVNP